MPRWSVETHPKSEQIIKALINGTKSQRSIAKQFGISHASVRRYLLQKLTYQAAKVAAEKDRYQGEELLKEVEHVMHRMRLLYDACHEYLEDPKKPGTYYLGPRAQEMDVVYYEKSGRKMVKRRMNLQTLISRLRKEHKKTIVEVKYKHTDPRKLIVDTASTLTRQLELIGKIQGHIKDIVIHYTLNEIWIKVKSIIYKATEKYPQVREKIIEQLEDADAQSD
jgi:transposase